jgi:hypothetical protein
LLFSAVCSPPQVPPTVFASSPAGVFAATHYNDSITVDILSAHLPKFLLLFYKFSLRYFYYKTQVGLFKNAYALHAAMLRQRGYGSLVT